MCYTEPSACRCVIQNGNVDLVGSDSTLLDLMSYPFKQFSSFILDSFSGPCIYHEVAFHSIKRPVTMEDSACKTADVWELVPWNQAWMTD